MQKMELEVKILDINKEEFINKLNKLGAVFKDKAKQILYTYDFPTIYSRFIDILSQLNNPESKIKYDVAMEKLKLFFNELDNLFTNENKAELKSIIGYERLDALYESEKLLECLNNKKLIEFMKKFQNNSNKWVRVRQTNNKTTITVKHILANNKSSLQQMLETEIEVSNIEEANNLLEALGFLHKSYQEKERITYLLDGFEIDIDTWPMIPTYFEIEGNSEENLKKILNKLGFKMSDCVSCTADEVYRKYNKSMFQNRDLKFPE